MLGEGRRVRVVKGWIAGNKVREGEVVYQRHRGGKFGGMVVIAAVASTFRLRRKQEFDFPR